MRLRMKPTALKQARLERMMTQEDLSERSGVKVWSIYRHETDASHGVRPNTVVKLAEALGVDPGVISEVVAEPEDELEEATA